MSQGSNHPLSQHPDPSHNSLVDEDQVKKFLETLRSRNYEFYSDPRGKGALKDLQQTFPHPWLYVAELLQNAIDEGANRINILIGNDDHLIFEHNGNSFTNDDVKALCARGVSSKGAGTVGFMGVGFKAVFRSYDSVQVNSSPWRFRLNVPSVKGERFGDLQRDWIGAVLPKWDPHTAAPSAEMTCRFVLSGRLPDLDPIHNDLNRLFGEDKTLLALLAWRGVTELNWNGEFWLLSKSVTELDDSGDSQILLEALDETTSDLCRWIMFERHYQPSIGAIKRFLEHRQLDPGPEDRERVYAEASRARQVAIFLKLEEDGTPLPVARGSAFALLPTGVTLPVGVHVQADWLLVVSRQEIMQLAGNEWHEEILLQFPRLLRYYLNWLVSEQCGSHWEKGYDALPGKYRLDNEVDRKFISNEFREHLIQEIKDLAFLPVPSVDESTTEFLSPSDARTLPRPLAASFDRPEMKYRLLFGDRVISARLLGARAAEFIADLELIVELAPQELELLWNQDTVGEWIKQFDDRERDKLLAQLLASLADLDKEDAWQKAKLVCLPTESGEWADRKRLNRFPADWNMLAQEPEISSALESFLGPKNATLSWALDSYLAKLRSPALRFIESVSPVKLDELVDHLWTSLPEVPDTEQCRLVLKFTSWVRSKQPQRKSLVRRIMCATSGVTLQLLPAVGTLLADPYAGGFRKTFFPGLPVISSDYLNRTETTAADWRSFFESLPNPPKGAFKLNLKAQKMSRTELKKRLGQDYNPPTLRSSYLTKPWRGLTVDNSSYQLLNAELPVDVSSRISSHDIDKDFISEFCNWVLESPSMLREYITLRVAYIPYYENSVAEKQLSHPAHWVQFLTNQAWVFTKRGEGPFRPCDVLASEDPVRPDAPVAFLPLQFIELLKGAGILFGTGLPDAPAIEKLRVQGPMANMATLLELINEAIAEAGGDDEKVTLLRQVIVDYPLFPVPVGATPIDGVTRVSGKRLVRGTRGRSTLADWIVSLERFQPESPERLALERIHTIWPIPTTITADQIMDFLLWVWEMAPDAERVRGVMPRAYQYLREELSSNSSAVERWKTISHRAKVFTTSHRRWEAIEGNEKVFLDDLNHPSIQKVTANLELATPGHLGAEMAEQIATAKLLSLNLLSTRFSVEIRPEVQLPVPEHWQQGFDFIQKRLLDQLSNSDNEEEDAKSPAETGGTLLQLSRWQSIHTIVYDRGVEVHLAPSLAALRDKTVAVSGEPRDFAKELCRVLCDFWGLRRRHDLPEILPELAIRVTEISNQDLVATWISNNSEESEEEPKEVAKEQPAREPEEEPHVKPVRKSEGESEEKTEEQPPHTNRAGKGHFQQSQVPGAPNSETTSSGTGTGKPTKPTHNGETHNPRPKRNRMLSYVVPQGAVNEDPPDTASAERRRQIDETGMKRVKEHEEAANREPEIMPHFNEGFDIKSYENGKLVRYIEVKSLSGDWDIDNVKMTHTQFEYATEVGDRYWLYVVERAEQENYLIHQIQNPAKKVTSFIFDYMWQALEDADEPLDSQLQV